MNPYDELEVPTNANEREIKKAYKRSAAKHHPDKSTGDTQKFQVIKLAYDVLSDPQRRAKFDETGDIDTNRKGNPIEERLTQLFTSIINSEQFTGDIVNNAVDIVNKSLGDLVSAIDKSQSKITKLEKRLGRVSVSDGDNMFEIILSSNIGQLKSQVSKMSDEQSTMNGVLERLKLYTDESPESPPQWSAMNFGGV
jgi:DnaJ-class molecular chaperone